jgi:hypothetical protein
MQDYKDNCQCLLVPVPIRHLPTEILVQIFEIHSAASGFPDFMQSPPHEFETQLNSKCLAHARLLTVSQACARWHDIVIGTPTFWTMFELNSIIWSTSSGVAKTTQLLEASLERGQCAPITVKILDFLDQPPPRKIFRMLLQHCR